MTFFNEDEFNEKYELGIEVAPWQIEMACEMIFSQVGLRYRRSDWNEDTCPLAIKNASMEQLRFILEYQIPVLDNRGAITAGAMSSDLKTDYSTLALRILANAGLLYRGNPINQNMGMTFPFGN